MGERRAGPRKIPETTVPENINSDAPDMLRLLSRFLSLHGSCMERLRVCARCRMFMACFRERFLFLLCCRCRQLSCNSLGGFRVVNGCGQLYAAARRFQGHIW